METAGLCWWHCLQRDLERKAISSRVFRADGRLVNISEFLRVQTMHKLPPSFPMCQTRPSRPREDCISCRAGLKETHCDRKFAVYSLTCTICSKRAHRRKHNGRPGHVFKSTLRTLGTGKKTRRGENTSSVFTRSPTVQKKRHRSSLSAFWCLKKTSFTGKRGKPSKSGTVGQKSTATVAGN